MSISRLASDARFREATAFEQTQNPFEQSSPILRCVAQLSKSEVQRYSVAKALLCAADRAQGFADRPGPDVSRSLAMSRFGFMEAPKPEERGNAATQPARTLEEEVSNAIAAELPALHTGDFYIPWRLKAVGLDTKSNSAGAYMISNTVREPIDALTQQTRVVQLGASVDQNLTGTPSYPKEDHVLAAAWQAENGSVDATASDPTWLSLPLSPKMLISTTSFSKKLLAQSSVDIENFVRSRMVRGHAISIDAAAINGGATNEPVGLLQTANLPTVALGTNGGAATAASIHQLIRVVAGNNADFAGNGFLSTPVQREKLSQLPAFTNAGGALWVGDEMLGHRALVSNAVPNSLSKGTSSPPASGLSAIIYGNWGDVVIGFWGALVVTVDAYKLKKQAQVEVCSFATVDLGIRNINSFAAIVDAT